MANLDESPPAEPVKEYKGMLFKAVVVYDNDGNYIIHGTNSETAAEMFKAIAPVWSLDPIKETARYIEFHLEMPIIKP